MDEQPTKIDVTIHRFMELWPLWAVIGLGVLGYIRQQTDVSNIKAQMQQNKEDRDRQVADRDAKVAERQKKADSDHDALTRYMQIVDCMRHHDCR